MATINCLVTNIERTFRTSSENQSRCCLEFFIMKGYLGYMF